MSRIIEVSDNRLEFLRQLSEYTEVIIPEEEGVQQLVSFLQGLDAKFNVTYLPIWALYTFRKCAKFRLLAPLEVKEIRRRGFNRTRVEVQNDGIFAAPKVRGS